MDHKFILLLLILITILISISYYFQNHFFPQLIYMNNDPFVFRKLNYNDYSPEYFQLLKQLTEAEQIDRQKFKEILDEINKNSNIYVLEDITNKKIVASATLIIEHKLIRNGGKVGHLEDVVVDENYRGNNLGKNIVLKIIDLAKENGCYKIIGDCSPELLKFYEKMGFQNKGNQIAIYF